MSRFPVYHPDPFLWTLSMTSSPTVVGWCSQQATREERNKRLGFLGTEMGICSKWWIIQQAGGFQCIWPGTAGQACSDEIDFFFLNGFQVSKSFFRVWRHRLKCLRNNNNNIIFTLMSCNYWLFLWSINLAIIFVNSIKRKVKKKN